MRRRLLQDGPSQPVPSPNTASAAQYLDGSTGIAYVVVTQTDPTVNASGEGGPALHCMQGASAAAAALRKSAGKAPAPDGCQLATQTSAASLLVCFPCLLAGTAAMTNQAAQDVPETVQQLNAAFYLGEVCAAGRGCMCDNCA